MHPKLFLFILQATFIILVHLQVFLAQNSEEYQSCIKPFQCGNMKNISYPFWGGRRPLQCGYPGFELDCQGNDSVPLLNILSLSYRVLQIDFPAHTLKVAREDLWNNTCTSLLMNTDLDYDLFERYPDSDYSSVTLFFDCSYDNNKQPQETLPNQFSCDVDGVETMNLFRTGDAESSGGPGSGITCENNISVPINQTADQALQNPGASAIYILRDALASGFLIQWSAENANCRKCLQTGETCVYSRNLTSTVCYANSEGQARPPPSPPPPPSSSPPPPPPRPGSPVEPRGTPPVVSPGAPPESTPPVVSPGAPPESNSPRNDGSDPVNPHSPIGLIVGLILAVIGTTIITIFIVYLFKRQRLPSGPNKKSKQVLEKFLLQHGSLIPKRYKYSEIKKITKSFIDKLGQGGYGSVYKGTLPDGSLVAVKVLTETNSDGEEFINEVASISKTSHINIVNLLGFCYDGKKRALIYEFMPNKSLDKFISNSGSPNANCHLDLATLYKIVVGVAKGLEYLHTGCNTRIVHFDIKPQNILLDEDFCPKISDFGLARLCKKKQSILSMLGARGTIGYIAPEVFSRNFGGVSHKSDVYSYGMMVLEMTGARKIEETEAAQSSENCFPDKIYDQVILDVARRRSSPDDFMIEEEEEETRKMFLVGFWCVQTNPLDRPSMSKVVEMLEGSVQCIQIPPKPTLFCPNTLSRQAISPLLSEYLETYNSVES